MSLRAHIRTAATVTSLLGAMTGAGQAGEWRITAVNDVPTEGDARIAFTADGSLGGSTGCNKFQMSGRMENGRLLVEGPIAVTQMACAGDAVTRQEGTILSLFEAPVDVAFDPFTGQVTLSRDGNRLSLVAVGATESPDAEPPQAPAPLSLAEAGFVRVFGLSGNLNIHAGPDLSSTVVGKVPVGTLLRNKGCQQGETHDWCNVVFLDASGTEGWAASDYVEPADAALRAGQGIFDQIGTLACGDAEGAAMARCDYGVARDPDGSAAVAIFRGDGTQRLLSFANGALVFVDGRAAAGEVDVAVSQQGDRTIVAIGAERYEIAGTTLTGP